MDNRPEKEWLQLWYKETGENVRWNKDQAWKALQWTLALLAIMVPSSKQGIFPAELWCTFAIVVTVASCAWLWTLHNAATRERSIGEGLVRCMPEREQYLPPLPTPERWPWLLLVKILLLSIGCFIVCAQILHGAHT